MRRRRYRVMGAPDGDRLIWREALQLPLGSPVPQETQTHRVTSVEGKSTLCILVSLDGSAVAEVRLLLVGSSQSPSSASEPAWRTAPSVSSADRLSGTICPLSKTAGAVYNTRSGQGAPSPFLGIHEVPAAGVCRLLRRRSDPPLVRSCCDCSVVLPILGTTLRRGIQIALVA